MNESKYRSKTLRNNITDTATVAKPFPNTSCLNRADAASHRTQEAVK